MVLDACWISNFTPKKQTNEHGRKAMTASTAGSLIPQRFVFREGLGKEQSHRGCRVAVEAASRQG